MKLNAITVSLMTVACVCQGDSGAATVLEPPPEAPLVVSTNDLVRILQGASALPYVAAASNLYRNHSILLNPQGNLKARFERVAIFSTQYELMSKLAECLIGCRVKVRKQPDGSYLYTNEAGKQYRIRVIRDECDARHFQGVYYITGEKLFVKLEALLHLESRPNAEGGIVYGARIYARSDSHVFNFFSRILLVKGYLTDEVTTVVNKFDAVYDEMTKDPAGDLKKVMEFRDPKADLHFTDQEIEIAREFVSTLRQ